MAAAAAVRRLGAFTLARIEQACRRTRQGETMLHSFLRTVVKVAVASLIVGAILTHFGITLDMLMKEVGLSHERVQELARQGFDWALPNLTLGSVIIVPLWFLVFILRPPGPSSD